MEDQYKPTFVIHWGTFVWVVMPFGVKNDPSNYQHNVNKTFHECIDLFVKIFFDGFTIFNNMETHLNKLKLCFLKCRESGISLNLEKCAFMVYYSFIVGFIVYKEGKLYDLKKIQAILNM